MNRFSQFDIKVPEKGLTGNKIKITKILNKEIVIHHFKVVDSKIEEFKKKGTGKCLHMQISFNNEMHVVFTSGTALIEVIQQIPLDKFPFASTIIEENDRYIFT